MVPLSHPVTPQPSAAPHSPLPPAALGFLGAGAGSLCHRLSPSGQHAALGLERVQLGLLHLPLSI